MALDTARNVIWAATGGGPLYELDASTGAVLAQFGDSLTQALAIQAGTGLIYVSSGNGIEIFDPGTDTFSHFSDIRVGSLAFAPDGTLWAVTWPHNQGQVISFTGNKPKLMLSFDDDVNSIAFGLPGSKLDGLMFVSHTDGSSPGAGTVLSMVDLATMKVVDVASGGTRGDIVTTSADGRVFLSQSNQVDVLGPVRAPHVASTNPPPDSLVALPFASITVTFDDDMLATAGTDPRSVLDPDNYQLVGDGAGLIPIQGVAYDKATRTAVLSFAPLTGDHYQLKVLTGVQNVAGLGLAQPYVTDFTTVSDVTSVLDIDFTDVRSDRSTGTVSFDVTVTNKSSHALVLPLILQLTPQQQFAGEPLGISGRAADGSWLIDLSDNLPANGVLAAGQSTSGRTVTVSTPDRQPVAFDPSVSGVLAGNHPPVFLTYPVMSATAGQAYTYKVVAYDKDGDPLSYVLVKGPAGMTMDASTGVVSWMPTPASPSRSTVVLQVYDAAGGYDTPTFTLTANGTNRAPVLTALPSEIDGKEGQVLTIPVQATDADGDKLIYWVNNLPPGATFDEQHQALIWTPGFGAAGTYTNVTFVVSDGLHQVSETTTVVIAPTPQAPTLLKPSDFVANEGVPIRIALQATDPDGKPLTYSSDNLPPGSFLDPNTGVFEWTPDYTQHGLFNVPFTVSNGEASTTQSSTIVVNNVNAAPVFQNLDLFQGPEGQQIQFRVQAFDPDNPTFQPPDRAADGSLVHADLNIPTVTYTLSGVPNGATFDPDTLLFTWTPGYGDAGQHVVTITATDNGDNTGQPLSATQSVTFNVLNVNRAPQVAPITSQSVDHDTVLQIPVSAVDPDGDPLKLVAIGVPDFGTFVDNGDGTGLLTFTPTADNRGNYTISLKATDNGDGNGSGAVLSNTQSFTVTVNAPDAPPHIVGIGNKVAVVGQPFQLVIKATDADQDPLTFSATGLPPDAVMSSNGIYGQTVLSFTPTAADIGKYSILVSVHDSGDGNSANALSDQQLFTLNVRTSNQAPAWVTAGDQTVTTGQTLTVNLKAVDPDGDTVTYSAANLPAGAKLDPVSGVLTWAPGFAQAGKYSGIVLSATDGSLTTTQTIAITVVAANEAPQFIPLQAQSGREGTALQFTLSAEDPNNDPLTYSLLSALPDGATFDPQTAKFAWTPGFEQAGDYTVQFGVADPLGLTDTLTASIHIDNVDRAPTLAVTNHGVVVGNPFSMQLVASDPDLNTTLSFSANSIPAGATLDPQTGLFTWTPGPTQTGDYAITFSVTDGELTTSQVATLRSTLNPVPPQVIVEITPSFPDVPGTPVLLHVAASSESPIEGLTLSVNGQALTLDSHGRASYVPQAPGQFQIDATATDADGVTGAAHTVLKVRDPADHTAPVVSIDNLTNNALVTAPIDLQATVSDSNLDSWVLEQALVGSNDFTTLASGTTPVSGTVYHLDPGGLRNGAYELRLTATDISGRTTVVETTLQIDTAAKPAAYVQNTTDLSVVLGGTTVDLVRSYSSLDQDLEGSFGFGWRLANLDPEIQTSVAPTGLENLGTYNPFVDGTRVYLTLPDGERVGFTFEAQKHEQSGVTYYTPAFVADPGVSYGLTSAPVLLSKGPNGYYELQTARPYNPSSGAFGGADYTLTAADGTVYDLSAAKGMVDEILPNGNTLHFSDSGIVSSNGDAVQFVRDAAGRITSIVASDGTRVVYTYDSAGNLVSAHNTDTGLSSRYGYAVDDPHLLTVATSPTAAGSVINYGPTAQVTPLGADLGGAGDFQNVVYQGSLTAGKTDYVSFNLRTSELDSTPTGEVLVGVEVTAANGSSLDPGVPEIAGLTPLIERSGNGTSFAVFAVSREGLDLIEIAGANAATAGDYSLRLFVVGDANQDGKVDGLDSTLVSAAQGSTAGQPNYSLGADANRDGKVDATDAQLLANNYGFLAAPPPQVQAKEVLTHVDLPLTVDLNAIANDPEGDPLFFKLVGASNGTATLNPDGHTVTFTPGAGFSGQADFQFQADDSFNKSAVATVTVDVSSAALVNLDFVNRAPRLDVGGGQSMVLVGDFEDQKDVALPASYVSFQVLDPSVAFISSTGQLQALKDGITVLLATSHGVTAATAVTVGVPTDALDLRLYNVGLDLYPLAVSLSSEGGTRQFDVHPTDDPDGLTDLAPASSGTLYFVNRPGVVTVSADGLVSAVAPGSATVTIIDGPTERVVPVLVQVPQTGTVSVGADGAVVEGSDGSIVGVPPGVLTDTPVSIAPVTVAELPQAPPGDFTVAAAFKLDIGDGKLDVPVQLAIPVAPGTPVGTEVMFLRSGQIVGDDGNVQNIWWQRETGVVGADGFAHTQSPPEPGASSSGYYLVIPTGTLGTVDIAVAGGAAVASNVAFIVDGGDGSLIGVSAAADAAGLASGTLAFPSTAHPLPLAMQIIPQIGLPTTVALGNVLIEPGKISHFTTTITPPPPADGASAPVITQAEISINDDDPANAFAQVTIKGQGFLTPNPGQAAPAVSDLRVVFQMPGEAGVREEVTPTGSDTQLIARIPYDVVAGLAEITVVRPDAINVKAANDDTAKQQQNAVSNAIRLDASGTYVFVTQPEYKYVTNGINGSVAVFDGDPNSPTFNQLIANIPVGTSDAYPYPREVAVTPDNTRAYVTLEGAGTVAVIDALSLQEVDVNSGRQVSLPPVTAADWNVNGVRLEPALDGVLVNDDIPITGTVNFSNLIQWKLELTSLATGLVTELASDNKNVTGQTLATLTPGDYDNGIYNIKLTATTLSGDSEIDYYVQIEADPTIKEIHLPLPAAPYGIAIDPTGTYAYVVDALPHLLNGERTTYLYVIDIDPASPKYNEVVNIIHLQHSDPLSDGSMPETALPQIAPTGARDIAVSADGLRIYIAAGNYFDDPSPGAPSFQLQDGNLIEVTLNPSTDNSVPTVASIVAIPASKATYGVATDPSDSNEVVFTNAETDDFGVEVVDDANGQKQNVPLDLNQGSSSLLSVHSANGIAVFTYTNPQTGAQETYAFVAGRADIVNNTFFTDQDDDPAFEGGNVGIIKDPFGPNPQLIAATRPIADGFPTDLALSADGEYLYVSYQGLGVATANGISNGALLVFNAEEIVKQIDNPANAPYLNRVAIDDLPLNQSNQRSTNTAIDVAAAYGLDPSNPFANVFKVLDPAHAPIAIGGYPGGIAVQKGAIPTPTVLKPAAGGGDGETDQFEIYT